MAFDDSGIRSYGEGLEQYSNSQVFNFINHKDDGVSLTTLFALQFHVPKIWENGGINPRFKNKDNGQFQRYFNIYATAINMPSKQLMTGQVVDVGTPIKYATGVGFGSVNITFQMPRNHFIRSYFEEWMNSIVADSNTFVTDYHDYVCKRIRIYKLEKGKGTRNVKEKGYDNQIFRRAYPISSKHNNFKCNQVVACMELRNVFPQNLGTTQLNQRDSRLSTLTVGLSYERYRFYNEQTSARSNGSFLDNVLQTDNSVSGDGQGRWGGGIKDTPG